MGLRKSGVEPTPIQDLNFEKSSFGQEVSQMDSNLRLRDTSAGVAFSLNHSATARAICYGAK